MRQTAKSLHRLQVRPSYIAENIDSVWFVIKNANEEIMRLSFHMTFDNL